MKLKSILTVALVAASIMVMAGGKNAAMAACAGVAGGTGAANTLCTTSTGLTGLDGTTFMWQGAVGTTNNQFNLGAVAGAFAGDALGVLGSGTGLVGGMPAQVAFAAGDYTSGVGPTSGYLLNQALFGMCPSPTTCPKFVPVPGTDVAVFDTGSNNLSLTYANYVNATGGPATAGGAFDTQPAGTASFNQGTFETGLVTGYNEGAAANIGILSQKTYHHNFTGVVGADGDYIDQRLAQQIDANNTSAAAGQQRLAQSLVAQAGSGGQTTVPGGAYIPGSNIDATWVGNGDGCGIAVNANLTGGNCGVVNQQITDSIAGAGINGTTGVVLNGAYGQLFNPLETSGANTIVAAAPTGPNTTYTGPAISTAASPLTLP